MPVCRQAQRRHALGIDRRHPRHDHLRRQREKGTAGRRLGGHVRAVVPVQHQLERKQADDIDPAVTVHVMKERLRGLERHLPDREPACAVVQGRPGRRLVADGRHVGEAVAVDVEDVGGAVGRHQGERAREGADPGLVVEERRARAAGNVEEDARARRRVVSEDDVRPAAAGEVARRDGGGPPPARIARARVGLLLQGLLLVLPGLHDLGQTSPDGHVLEDQVLPGIGGRGRRLSAERSGARHESGQHQQTLRRFHGMLPRRPARGPQPAVHAPARTLAERRRQSG